MEDHIKDLLASYHYSEEIKEQVAFRVLFGGESPEHLLGEFSIQNVYTINLWVRAYRLKIESGLVTLPPMTAKQQQDLEAVKHRNKELEKALKNANLMILALNTMIDIAEKDLKIPIRKKSGTKQS